MCSTEPINEGEASYTMELPIGLRLRKFAADCVQGLEKGELSFAQVSEVAKLMVTMPLLDPTNLEYSLRSEGIDMPPIAALITTENLTPIQRSVAIHGLVAEHLSRMSNDRLKCGKFQTDIDDKESDDSIPRIPTDFLERCLYATRIIEIIDKLFPCSSLDRTVISNLNYKEKISRMIANEKFLNSLGIKSSYQIAIEFFTRVIKDASPVYNYGKQFRAVLDSVE